MQPWLRLLDGTYALVVYGMMAGELLFALVMLYAVVAAPLLLVILPFAVVWRTAVKRRGAKAARIATLTGLVFSLIFHIPAALLMVYVAITDADTHLEWFWLRTAGVVLGAVVTVAALFIALREERA